MKFRKVTLHELVRVMSRDTGLNDFLVHRFAYRFISISCSHNRMCEKHVDLFSFIKYMMMMIIMIMVIFKCIHIS